MKNINELLEALYKILLIIPPRVSWWWIVIPVIFIIIFDIIVWLSLTVFVKKFF